MNNIDHLSNEEKEHFILCGCGDYIDMRNLDEVFEHQHLDKMPAAHWNYSLKSGLPVAHYKNGIRRNLN